MKNRIKKSKVHAISIGSSVLFLVLFLLVLYYLEVCETYTLKNINETEFESSRIVY